MKNKDFRLSLIYSLIITLFLIIILITINYKTIKQYEYNNNIIISKIINDVQEEYPEFDDIKIIEILNDEELKKDNILKKYGVNLNDSFSKANQKLIKSTIIIDITIIIIYLILTILILCVFNHKENKKIKKITNYIKEINNQNYELDILSNSEEDLSLLKNEIYKTAITLNEQAILLTKDKNTLKDSLSDISHQLKTPLTSITLMIDSLKDNKNLSDENKNKILNNIHRKISNINFLVHSLLKLSKFDANTVVFKDELNKIEDILIEVKDNLSILNHLK